MSQGICYISFNMNIEFYQQTFNAINAPILVVDDSGRILAVNPAFLKLFSVTPHAQVDYVGNDLFSHPVLASNNLCEMYQQLLSGDANTITNVVIPQSENADDTCFDIHIYPCSASADTPTNNYLVVHNDVTDLVAANEKATKANDLLDEIQEVASFGWWDLDIPTQTAVWSKQLYYLLGYEPGVDEAEPEKFLARIHPEDREKAIADLEKPFKDHGPYASQFRLLLPDGKIRHISEHGRVLFDEQGKGLRYLGTSLDVTDSVISQERIKFLAHHDSLTRLPNRVLFLERLEHAVTIAKRYGRELTILFLDLDGFKVINDSLGHQFGDLLLKVVSTRLLNCIREADTIARLGGDEFAILIEESMNISDISILANKILDMVALPIHIQEREMHISTSIGISSFPQDGVQPGLLLSNADIAMYKAKETGRNNYAFYSSELTESANDRLKIENALRRALDNNEFHIHYQPQMNVNNGKIEGMEALIRWQSPEFGLVMPTEFIYILEEIGLINAVGAWVIQTTCRQLKAWHDDGYSELSMSINLSSRQFNNSSIVENVQQAISANQLDPNLIDLEITESLLMRNVKSVDDTLSELSRLGINVAIDDFGTGYSSLGYLKRFPIDILKIDRSFIKDIIIDASSSDEIEIVKTIIAMGKTLNMKTIAEGVENEEQKVFLTENGCDMIQGYLLSKPLSVENMNDWLSEHYS